jgi:hypothetical protein
MDLWKVKDHLVPLTMLLLDTRGQVAPTDVHLLHMLRVI